MSFIIFCKKGVNYVFDERLGARVTEDIISLCETCGAPNDQFLNCNNYRCHVSLCHIFLVEEKLIFALFHFFLFYLGFDF